MWDDCALRFRLDSSATLVFRILMGRALKDVCCLCDLGVELLSRLGCYVFG